MQMSMSFEWFIARRYLTARRRQAFISLISGVSILGVGVGVMAVIIALALMTGVQGELRDRIVGSEAHVYVYKIGAPFNDVEAELKQLMVPGVVGARAGDSRPGAADVVRRASRAGGSQGHRSRRASRTSRKSDPRC